MYTIIRRGDHVLHPYRSERMQEQSPGAILKRQEGFTLPELLVSLCILCILMHGVWQWGTVLYRSSDTMAQNQQAVYIAQQLYAGLSPACPEGWKIHVDSVPSKGMIYETTIQIQSNHRRWKFYYAGPEEIVYAAAENSS